MSSVPGSSSGDACFPGDEPFPVSNHPVTVRDAVTYMSDEQMAEEFDLIIRLIST